MDLTCYIFPSWRPRIRAAQAQREWMDQSAESYAYRCLPLNIANAHGWEMLSPIGFSAMWNGGMAPEDVTIVPDEGAEPSLVPEALFGMGIVTLHVSGLLRTPPGWDLWVSGPPNRAKDGIAPLGGVIETDWSPFSFTMNWRLTRPDHWVRFEENEPFAFFFPIERRAIEAFEPRFLPIDEEPELKARFLEWSRSRDAFQLEMKSNPPPLPADRWQKFYYRGTDASGRRGATDHRTKIRLKEFANSPAIPAVQSTTCPATSSGQAQDSASVPASGSKRDWLLTILERHRNLSPEASAIPRVGNMRAEQFLRDHYATNRPIILSDAITDWPALHKWTPDYLRQTVGDLPVTVQGNRQSNPRFERDKEVHRQRLPFSQFLDLIVSGSTNDIYLTAFNSADNAGLMDLLGPDLGYIDELMDRNTDRPFGMPWIGPAGTFTPLHHDLTNNLMVQLIGRKRILLAAPGETPRLYNDEHVFSAVEDLENFDVEKFPLARDAAVQTVELQPGDVLFLPIGWWHQVEALDLSITLTQTNFRWPNDAFMTYPR